MPLEVVGVGVILALLLLSVQLAVRGRSQERAGAMQAAASATQALAGSAAEQTRLLLERMERLQESQGAALAEQGDRLTQQMQERLHQSQELLQQHLEGMGTNLSLQLGESRQTVERVNRDLGELRGATQRVVEVGDQVRRLEQALAAPKLRGGMGEVLLENMLSQVFPSGHWERQHRFANGETVDAVVCLDDVMVPIDAKFPVEAFTRAAEAQSDEERASLLRAAMAQVRHHIRAVRKYIRPDEGTLDYALMYIPSESVYYETLVSDPDAALAQLAFEQRVVPVSPSTLYAYLMVILRGLQAHQVEHNSRHILDLLARLELDFRAFLREFDTLGTHLNNAQRKHADAVHSLGHLERGLDEAARLQSTSQEPAALEAASRLSEVEPSAIADLERPDLAGSGRRLPLPVTLELLQEDARGEVSRPA
jgi:DNA recombination protein RmuC